jgi:sec-independent protein translocase protein TatA
MFAYNFGPSQIIILLLLGVLLFGNRLPEVGRTLAKTLREFRNTWRGLEDEVLGTMTQRESPSAGASTPPRITAAAQRLDSSPDGSPMA